MAAASSGAAQGPLPLDAKGGPAEPAIPEPSPSDTSPSNPATETPSRRSWTRERVVTELATWLLEEPGIDAATLTRRGQGTLANWARRLFGRFDAAMNAANLRLAELYPEGPPSKSSRVATTA